MEVKTYRAGCLRDALRLVRDDLGPDAAVLHTREVRGGLMRWMLGPKQIEVTASADVQVPSRLPQRKPQTIASPGDSMSVASKSSAPKSAAASHAIVTKTSHAASPPVALPAILGRGNDRSLEHDDLRGQLNDLHSLVEDLCRKSERGSSPDWPDALFELFTDLVEADFSDEAAQLIERVRRGLDDDQLRDARRLRRRLHRQIADEIETSGPIVVDPARTRLVALVGPTGVGKTTTIAKLAANFHLHERLRIGLITVDTYRIAAIDQLRTYAEIIDLPMEVASTPHELRTALQRMAGLDLILMDTAGRSPRDEAQLVELKRMLCEVNPDEIHLVLSSGASLANLKSTARRFSDIGATSLVLTKLDEAHALGNLLPLLRACRLPLSYLTTGQNVPDDIEVADADRLARAVWEMRMSDQATELRKLVMRAARERVAAAAPPPKMIALFGGRPGVGVTTLAMELALAVARQGFGAVLVDANLRRADIAGRCQLRENNGIAEVLAARRDVHEVLERGPCGLQILPGPASPIHHEVTLREQQRLLQQIHTLGLHADWVLVDAGEIANPLLTLFWRSADQPVLVTTSESSVLMDSYASLKTLHALSRVDWPRLIVNRVDDATTADEVATRIGRSCERFLETQLGFAGFIPENLDLSSAGEPEPWQPGDTETPAARAIVRLAAEFTQSGSRHNRAGPNVA